MQLRSGRRLVSPPPVPQGGVRRCRRRRCPGGGDGEDRIGGLPEELRLEVLRRVGLRCARDAVRTGVLSRDWRGLWTGLRDLTFDDVDPDTVEGALAQVRSEQLDRLEIRLFSGRLAAARITSLLRAADRLDPAELVVWLEKDSGEGPFELPCFKRATSIELDIKVLHFTLPPSGHFASLETLHLMSVTVDLRDLLPCCPLLRKLLVDYWNLPRGATIRSKSIQELDLLFYYIHNWRVVSIMAPELKKFMLRSPASGEFAVSLSAPKVEEFSLQYTCQHPRVGSGDKWRLWSLSIGTEWRNRHGHRSRVHVLSLTILEDHCPEQVRRSFAQEITRLPLSDFSILELNLRTEGHVFGALLLQLLRIRTAIQELKVVLREINFKDHLENCDCDEDSNWKNEQISLPYLEVVEIQGFGVAGHEVDFLELLFRSSPMLKKMTIALSRKASSNNEQCQKLHSLFEANASVEFSVL